MELDGLKEQIEQLSADERAKLFASLGFTEVKSHEDESIGSSEKSSSEHSSIEIFHGPERLLQVEYQRDQGLAVIKNLMLLIQIVGDVSEKQIPGINLSVELHGQMLEKIKCSDNCAHNFYIVQPVIVPKLAQGVSAEQLSLPSDIEAELTPEASELIQDIETYVQEHLASTIYWAMTLLISEAIVQAYKHPVPVPFLNELKKQWDEVLRKRLTFRKSGGPNNVKYDLSPDEEQALRSNYEFLKEEMKKVKQDFRKVYKSGNKHWQDALRAMHPTIDLPDNILELLTMPSDLRNSPSNLAMELAMRRSIKGYKPFDLNADWMKKKLSKGTADIAK